MASGALETTWLPVLDEGDAAAYGDYQGVTALAVADGMLFVAGRTSVVDELLARCSKHPPDRPQRRARIRIGQRRTGQGATPLAQIQPREGCGDVNDDETRQAGRGLGSFEKLAPTKTAML